MEWMMPKDDERGYFERRAEKELLMAEATNDPNACASHYQLANLYLGLVYSDGEAAGAEAAQLALHFVGFRGDEYTRAVRIFGPPDFIHLGWDVWARQEIMSGDAALFARGTFEDQPSEYSFPDIKEG